MKNPSRLLKLLVAVAMSLLLTLTYVPHDAQAAGTVVITKAGNPILYNALISKCGFPNTGSITDAQLAGLIELTLDDVNGLTNIDGLQYCSNLVVLALGSHNELNSLPPDLSGMTKLEVLALDGVKNLQELTNLHSITTPPNLRSVQICNTDIKDVSFLNPTAAPNLKTLLWSDNPSLTAADFASLSTLTQLENLDLIRDAGLSANHGAALATLAGMSKLTIVDMSESCLYDISQLSGVTHIQVLDVDHNYLDPTPGSTDMTVLNSMQILPNLLDYSNQNQIVIHYNGSGAVLSKNMDTVYYEQMVNLPTISSIPSGYMMTGWDTDGNGTADYAAGASITFTNPSLPVTGNSVTYTAVLTSPDAISASSNTTLYNALMDMYPAQVGKAHAGYITEGEFVSLSGELNLSSKGITSIDGLQFCTGITGLNLSGNAGLSTIELMESLDNKSPLKTLNLSGTAVSAIPAALDMPNLTSIDISNNAAITDAGLDGIESSGLPALVTLTANNCSSLHTIDTLTLVPALTTLHLDGDTLTAFPANMAAMTGLHNLTLRSCPNLAAVTNLDKLSTLPNLTMLVADNTNINSALSSVGACTGLTQLFMENCNITNINPIQSLSNLSVLSLSSNAGLKDIGPIAAMTNLTQLYISNTIVDNISMLSNMSHLNTFYATYTCINDISVLAGKPLQDVNVAVDYLDPSPGSADIAVINSLKSKGCNVTYNDQMKITITYFCDSAVFNGAPPSDVVVYYGQNVTLPSANAKQDYAMTGWSTDGDYSPDHPGGAIIPFTWHTLPILANPGSPGIPATQDNNVLFYAINTTLDASHELSGLTASAALSPAFDPTISYYTIALPASSLSVTLTPKVTAPGTTFTIDGASITSKTISLGCGATASVAINVINGTGMQYFVVITRAAPEASKLLGIGNSTGTLSPAFDPYKTSYTLTLAEGTGSVTLAPVKAASSSKLTINGATLASKPFSVNPGGSTTVTLKVVSTANAATTYTVVIKRNKSTNANLKSLSASYALKPAFSAAAAAYTVTIPENKGSFTVKASKVDANATMKIDGKNVTSKTYSISYGQTKTVTIVVTAQAGNKKTIKITLTRPPHIKSFKGKPVVSGYPTVITGKPLTFSYSIKSSGGSTATKIQIKIGNTWKNLYSRTGASASKTFVWDGKVNGIKLAAGKYSVRITSVFGGASAVTKAITVAVK